MVDYLEHLIESRQWEQAIRYAEEILLQGNCSQRDIMVTNRCLLTARIETGEVNGALVAGQMAIQMALDLQEWDYYGTCCVDMGLTHVRLQQSDLANHYYYEYLAKLPYYVHALRWEADVCYNLGRNQASAGQIQEAIQSFERALRAADRTGDSRVAHGVRHALIETYIKAGEVGPVPQLLARCAHYLRHHPRARDIRQSRLYHLDLRAQFALLTNRFDRALAIALRGLQESEGDPQHQYDFHMVLARIALRTKFVQVAFGHLLAARVYSVRCRRYDLEARVSEHMYKIMKDTPNVLQEMECYIMTDSLSPMVGGAAST